MEPVCVSMLRKKWGGREERPAAMPRNCTYIHMIDSPRFVL